MTLPCGAVIDDRYTVLSLVGNGGMGSVYKASQHGLDRPVAIKMMHAGLQPDSEAYARFEREAQAISCLKHKNIVLFYEFGVWQQAPYMVMECVDGVSLDRILEDGQPLPVPRALDIARQICAALACAHSHGIVHRDLKPNNVIVSKDGEDKDLVKVIDFGLAKLMPSFGRDMQKLTEAGCTVGSALYMSPEQCLGQTVDQRSDIYAAACILQQCLTGMPVFSGGHSVVVMNKHVSDRPPALSEARPDSAGSFPAGLQSVLDRALAKDPAERYQSAEDLEQALEEVAAGRGSESRRRALPPLPGKSPEPARKMLLPVMLAAACCCLLVLFTGLGRSRLNTAGNSPSSADFLSEALADNVPDERRQQLLKQAIEANKIDARLDASRMADAYSFFIRGYLVQGEKQKALDAGLDGLSFINNSQVSDKQRASIVAEYARALHANLRYPAAVSLLSEEIVHHPNGPQVEELRFLLGTSLQALGKFQHAQLVLRRIKRHPGDSFKPATIPELLGNGLFYQGQYEQALQSYLPVVSEEGSTPGFLPLNVARCYLCLGNVQQAQKYLPMADEQRRLYDLPPLHERLMLQAISEIMSGKADQALVDASRCLDEEKRQSQLYSQVWIRQDYQLYKGQAAKLHQDCQALDGKIKELKPL